MSLKALVPRRIRLDHWSFYVVRRSPQETVTVKGAWMGKTAMACLNWAIFDLVAEQVQINDGRKRVETVLLVRVPVNRPQ
jgi:hypothetical protein